MTFSNWIDVTLTIKPGMVRWPGDPPVKIALTKSISRGDEDNLSSLRMSSHTGTHMDAPRHFIAGGKGLDKMPLEAVVGPARVLEIRDRRYVTVGELKPYKIRRGERVLFRTRNSAYWSRPTEAFQKDYVYIPPETADYLAKRGVRAVGVDYLSVGGYHADGATTHRALLGAGVWIIEGLDLSRVKPGKYDLICLPLKVLNSDGAPCRAVVRRQQNKTKDSVRNML